MASIENPVKDDSSSDGEDLSESAKLVGTSIKKGGSRSTSSSTITADGPLQPSPNSKPANNGVVLTGAFGDSSTTLRGVEDMEEPLEDSETAKLLGGSGTGKEKLTSGGKVSKSSSKEVVVKEVKESQRKLIKVAQNGEKTEIIIERSETVHENITNVERSAVTPPKEIIEQSDIPDKLEQNKENKDEAGDGHKKEEEVEEKKKGSDFENEKDVEDVKKDEILIITDTTDRGPKDTPEVDEGGSEVSPSDAATDSCEQDTDTYDLYQTVGSMTPNSLSNADVFRSLAATVASSQATFISADDTLGPKEEVPASPRSLHAIDLESVPLESVELESRNVEPGLSTPGGLGTEDEAEDGKETRQASQEHTEDEDTMREITFEDGAVLAPAVMYPAQVHQYCPPGLESLLDLGQLVIHRQNLRHNTVFNNDALNRMEVIDISRKVLFYVEEEAPPLSQQSFLFKVYNRNKQEVMQIYNPQSTTCIGCGASWHCFRKCNFQTLVFAPLGQVAGFVKRSHTYFVQEYLVLNSQEDVMLVMRGGPDDLEIYTPDLENELGRLAVHHWHGIMHEVRRSNKDYGITFPIDLDVRVKAVLLGAVFALDWMYMTKGGRLR